MGVVSVVSSVEKEQLLVSYVKAELMEMFECVDTDNASITKEEFERLLMMPHAVVIIQNIGVDVVGLVDIADYIFRDSKPLSFANFMDLILQLRGSNSATVKDIVDLRRSINTQLQEVSENMKECVARCDFNTSVAREKISESNGRMGVMPVHTPESTSSASEHRFIPLSTDSFTVRTPQRQLGNVFSL